MLANRMVSDTGPVHMLCDILMTSRVSARLICVCGHTGSPHGPGTVIGTIDWRCVTCPDCMSKKDTYNDDDKENENDNDNG